MVCPLLLLIVTVWSTWSIHCCYSFALHTDVQYFNKMSIIYLAFISFVLDVDLGRLQYNRSLINCNFLVKLRVLNYLRLLSMLNYIPLIHIETSPLPVKGCLAVRLLSRVGNLLTRGLGFCCLIRRIAPFKCLVRLGRGAVDIL